ncbi:protein ALWAYS EARLY 3-like isoform X2 [Phalaenopsis equestris]|uniref:protein ALWAYS EARLY 3-like isoform X2 n=1 Tax=Phalaenopsis equestris TaxID=78828 RepID=UPI0009E2DB3C|nr:protein ALWAYS EARLY 3-like isoform X2 [Phalaenopsis equestris]
MHPVQLMSSGKQELLNRPGRRTPEEMEPLVAPPPTKKRKLSKTENAKCNEKEFKNTFCKNGDDQEKVREVAGGGSQDVTVAFHNASEVPLRDKKDGEILKVYSDLKQGTRGMLQTCQSKIRKYKEEMAKAPQASHHDDCKERPKNCQRFSLFKTRNLKVEKLDLYALHLLADTALNHGSEPFFHVQVQKQEGESKNGLDEHEPLLRSNKSQASNVSAERNGGERSASESASVIQRDLQSEDVSLNVHVSPEANHAIFISINQNQNSNQELKKEDKKLISKDNFDINSHVAGFHVSKESQVVSTNADQKADGAKHECIDCQSSMCIQASTLESFQTRKSNLKDDTKLFCAPGRKVTFLCEEKERIDKTIAEKDDLYLKGNSECFREQSSVFLPLEPICDDKVSSASYELEPCSTCPENSQPRLLTCMETPQKSEGCPSSSTDISFFDRNLEDLQNSKGCASSFNTASFRNQSSGYRVREIVQSSKFKATSMVDVAIKAMSSIKAGEDAYAMIGEALESTGIRQVGVHSRISRLKHSSYQQNGGPQNCHQDLLCNPAEVASIVHSINSTVPTFSQNYSRIPPKLISACVAAMLMIQACSDRGLPPAEAMEILEEAARDLHPEYSQNLHIYREIEELMCIIKTQVLSLIKTPTSNLQM